MDLISGLSQAMGVDPNTATALAGAAMATVQGQAAEGAPEAASEMAGAVPEMSGWLDAAKAFVGGGDAAPAAAEDPGMLGGMMAMASSGVGNQLLGAVAGKQAQNTALLAGVLSKAGLDTSKAGMAAPIVLQFLQSRLAPGTLDTLMSAVPFLSGASQDAPDGLMGKIGGLLG